jgi:hypothetical protein
MEYYSANKKNEIPLFVVKWIELEDTMMLTDVNQMQKDKYYMYSLLHES